MTWFADLVLYDRCHIRRAWSFLIRDRHLGWIDTIWKWNQCEWNNIHEVDIMNEKMEKSISNWIRLSGLLWFGAAVRLLSVYGGLVVLMTRQIQQEYHFSSRENCQRWLRINIEKLLNDAIVMPCRDAEVTTSSDDPSYFLWVWNVIIQQHFLLCKWQGIQECLHRSFPMVIFPAVQTWFIVFPQPSFAIALVHLMIPPENGVHFPRWQRQVWRGSSTWNQK